MYDDVFLMYSTIFGNSRYKIMYFRIMIFIYYLFIANRLNYLNFIDNLKFDGELAKLFQQKLEVIFQAAVRRIKSVV